MDVGIMTLIVAVSFGVLGMIVGFLIGKYSCKDEKSEDHTGIKALLEREISFISTKLESLQNEIKSKIEKITETTATEIKDRIENFVNEAEKLKEELNKAGISQGSILAFEKALKSLKNLNISVPNIDYSVLDRVNDNLSIVRADLQALAMKKEKESFSPPLQSVQKTVPFKVDSLIDSINSAIRLAKEINARAVKDELLTLASLLKEKDKNEFLKDLDKQALTSKELVIVLTSVKKELEGVER